jgi:hypothetical protein
MPIETVVVSNITCDNPACPGNDLSKTDRTGWLFITSEVYGQGPQQSVFCSVECLNAATGSTPTLLTGEPQPTPEPV